MAAVAHSLEWSVPKVAALRYRRDVVAYVGKVSALYARRVLAQEQSAQIAPTRAAVSRLAVHTFARLALCVVPRAGPVPFRNACHSYNRNGR